MAGPTTARARRPARSACGRPALPAAAPPAASDAGVRPAPRARRRSVAGRARRARRSWPAVGAWAALRLLLAAGRSRRHGHRHRGADAATRSSRPPPCPVGAPLVSVDTGRDRGPAARARCRGSTAWMSCGPGRTTIGLKVTERKPRPADARRAGSSSKWTRTACVSPPSTGAPQGVPLLELAVSAARPSLRRFGDRAAAARGRCGSPADLPGSLSPGHPDRPGRVPTTPSSLELTGGRTVVWGSAETRRREGDGAHRADESRAARRRALRRQRSHRPCRIGELTPRQRRPSTLVGQRLRRDHIG